MTKNYYIDYSDKGYPVKELKRRYDIPPIKRCELCGDNGECRNNENSRYYDERLFGETDYLDCLIYYKTIRVRSIT